jgi:protein-L-isoaspartate(D-aspartate) O-methyltransferase
MPGVMILCLLCLPGTSQAEPQKAIADIVYQASEHFTDIETANLDNLLARIGNARVVLIGESSHGTAEFYEMRARITRELITRKGFNIVAMKPNGRMPPSLTIMSAVLAS